MRPLAVMGAFVLAGLCASCGHHPLPPPPTLPPGATLTSHGPHYPTLESLQFALASTCDETINDLMNEPVCDGPGFLQSATGHWRATRSAYLRGYQMDRGFRCAYGDNWDLCGGEQDSPLIRRIAYATAGRLAGRPPGVRRYCGDCPQPARWREIGIAVGAFLAIVSALATAGVILRRRRSAEE
ncbi:MAG TPA: hypothetical protein VFE86_03585 [Ilumatobacteraceae bacterium]|nr:hypothetical protein [Ilumatobacteraceae bacterium]